RRRGAYSACRARTPGPSRCSACSPRTAHQRAQRRLAAGLTSPEGGWSPGGRTSTYLMSSLRPLYDLVGGEAPDVGMRLPRRLEGPLLVPVDPQRPGDALRAARGDQDGRALRLQDLREVPRHPRTDAVRRSHLQTSVESRLPELFRPPREPLPLENLHPEEALLSGRRDDQVSHWTFSHFFRVIEVA